MNKTEYFEALDSIFENQLVPEIKSPHPIERKMMIINGSTVLTIEEVKIAKEYFENSVWNSDCF